MEYSVTLPQCTDKAKQYFRHIYVAYPETSPLSFLSAFWYLLKGLKILVHLLLLRSCSNCSSVKFPKNLNHPNVLHAASDCPLNDLFLSKNKISSKIVSEYDQEIPQSQTTDNPRGTTRKSRSTITRHQEDKLSKAISSLEVDFSHTVVLICFTRWHRCRMCCAVCCS